MHVEVGVLTSVNASAHILIRLVRGTELDSMSTRERTIEAVSGTSTSKHTDLEWTSSGVLCFGTASDSAWYYLRTPCGREATEAYVVIVLH